MSNYLHTPCRFHCSYWSILWPRHYIPILLDNVGCTGTESRLTSCTYSSHTRDCNHGDDAGVTCSSVTSGGKYYDYERKLIYRYTIIAGNLARFLINFGDLVNFSTVVKFKITNLNLIHDCAPMTLIIQITKFKLRQFQTSHFT